MPASVVDGCVAAVNPCEVDQNEAFQPPPRSIQWNSVSICIKNVLSTKSSVVVVQGAACSEYFRTKHLLHAVF